MLDPGASVAQFVGSATSTVVLGSGGLNFPFQFLLSNAQSFAARANEQSTKPGYDIDSVAREINFGFVGDRGIDIVSEFYLDSLPANASGEPGRRPATAGSPETGVDVPEDFGTEDEEFRKK